MMTDTALLRCYIEKSGYKLRFLASRLGISYQALLNKINNNSEFKASEITRLCELLEIDNTNKESVFFKTVDKTA